MTVTKQQQLEYLAKECHSWRGRDFVLASDAELGYRLPVSSGCHLITREEWRQERDKMQKQSAQGNLWHERGELPPVGAIVTVVNDCDTYNISDKSADCIGAECVVMAAFERDNGEDKVKIVCVMEPTGGCHCFRLPMIRPLRTKREKAIDAACKAIGGVGEDGLLIIERIYDAGLLK